MDWKIIGFVRDAIEIIFFVSSRHLLVISHNRIQNIDEESDVVCCMRRDDEERENCE